MAKDFAAVQSGAGRRQVSELPKDLELTGSFKDHFSRQSVGYAKYRPTYPRELFDFLASAVVDRGTALDCATGSGQAALALTEHFSTVIATDASASQIDAAIAHPSVHYKVAAAERTGLPDNSVDLLTVAQAFHWFDEEGFFGEASRVLGADGVVAIWCYETCTVSVACDAIVDYLYEDIVGAFWPPERAKIEAGYADVEMPGTELAVPELKMSLDWHAADMLGYLRTWSACKRFEADKGYDPVEEIAAKLIAAWGEQVRQVVWPLRIRVSRVN